MRSQVRPPRQKILHPSLELSLLQHHKLILFVKRWYPITIGFNAPGTFKKVKVTHSRLSSVGFRGWSRLLQSACRWRESYTRSIGCHYFPPGPQLPSQPLRGLVPALLLGKHRHNKREQFAQDCYPTASRLRFEPRPFCAWVQRANHSAAEAHLAFKILHVDNHRVSIKSINQIWL